MPEAVLHDGSTIQFEVHGAGPALLLPVDPHPVEGAQAEEMARWGADPALGKRLVDGLAGDVQVVAFDYEGHVRAVPKPDTLTPDNVVADVLAVADAAGADRFAWYGYSWLAMVGLQLAVRTDRLSALAMGGYPPLGGPYREMLQVTEATYALAVDPPERPAGPVIPGDWDSAEVTLSEAETRQFVTLYQALQDFDFRAAQAGITCPRLCFAGSADEIRYGERWGNVLVSLGGPVVRHRSELEATGWEVVVLEGLDHMGAMQADRVLPILRPWLAAVLAGQGQR
jgi:pimeloyl-ACP methyl ester carboxylesterase